MAYCEICLAMQQYQPIMGVIGVPKNWNSKEWQLQRNITTHYFATICRHLDDSLTEYLGWLLCQLIGSESKEISKLICQYAVRHLSSQEIDARWSIAWSPSTEPAFRPLPPIKLEWHPQKLSSAEVQAQAKKFWSQMLSKS